MYLNIAFPNQKQWKPFWVVLRDCWLDISVENGKEPFTSYHLGILKVKPSEEFKGRPNVLEFYDADGVSDINFYAFSYDPYDFLEFFKAVCKAYQDWRKDIKENHSPSAYQCEVRASSFLSPNLLWTVQPDKITFRKPGKDESGFLLLKDIKSCTPSSTTSHVGYFKYLTQKPNSDPIESKCTNLEQMKNLLNAIYRNLLIMKN